MKVLKYTSFTIGAGVGAFAGMAGGPIGMMIGCAIGVPLFGYLGVFISFINLTSIYLGFRREIAFA